MQEYFITVTINVTTYIVSKISLWAIVTFYTYGIVGAVTLACDWMAWRVEGTNRITVTPLASFWIRWIQIEVPVSTLVTGGTWKSRMKRIHTFFQTLFKFSLHFLYPIWMIPTSVKMDGSPRLLVKFHVFWSFFKLVYSWPFSSVKKMPTFPWGWISCHASNSLTSDFLRFICTAKVNFFFDICHCLMWTLNLILSEPSGSDVALAPHPHLNKPLI